MTEKENKLNERLIEASIIEGTRLLQEQLMARKKRLAKDLLQSVDDVEGEKTTFTMGAAISIEVDGDDITVYVKANGKTSWSARSGNRLLDPAQGKFGFVPADTEPPPAED